MRDRLITEVTKNHSKHCKRREDIVIRYGGDEFLLYANGTKEIAEQLIKTWKVRLEEEKEAGRTMSFRSRPRSVMH